MGLIPRGEPVLLLLLILIFFIILLLLLLFIFPFWALSGWHPTRSAGSPSALRMSSTGPLKTLGAEELPGSTEHQYRRRDSSDLDLR